MPRPKKAVPSLLRHKSSGQARVQIGGKDIYLGRWGSKEAREAYARLVAECEVATPALVQAAKQAAQPASLTVAELALLWLDWAETHYVKNGQPTSHLATFTHPIRTLRELYASTPASDFGPLALEAVRARMVKAGISRRTANAYASRIRSIFRWAVGRELVQPQVITALAALAPLKAGRTEAPETKPVAPVADAVVEATLAHLSAIVGDMVRLQRTTGMRPDEVCSLRPCDLNRSGEVWEYRPPAHKTMHRDCDRVVYFGPKAQALVTRYLLRPADAYCFSPREAAEQDRQARHAARKTPPTYGNFPGSKPAKRKPVRRPGERYTTNTYRRAIVRACERAHVEPWSPNQLRHAFATEARRVGGIEAVQVLLGHRELETSQVYAERQVQLAADVAKRIS